jgi:hypothetical protein
MLWVLLEVVWLAHVCLGIACFPRLCGEDGCCNFPAHEERLKVRGCADGGTILASMKEGTQGYTAATRTD